MAAATEKRTGINILVLLVFLVFTLAVGFVGGQVTAPNIPTWYVFLAKPSFNPPNWLFMPAWTTLLRLDGGRGVADLAPDRLAGALLVPTLAWVSFAGVLNFWVWRLNP